MTSLRGKTALITCASMGIGQAIADALAKEGVNLILISRSKDKLAAVQTKLNEKYVGVRTDIYAVDIQDHKAVDQVVETAVSQFGQIDILINNADLALGAPARFWELPIELVNQMNGTILNISSVTGLECSPFDGEAVYHANKACLEAFSNSLRMETAGSNIRVLVLRHGCVRTNFHLQRVKLDEKAMDDFFEGYEPLGGDDISDAVVYMLTRPVGTSIKALDCVPTAQRALTRFDREWNDRNGS